MVTLKLLFINFLITYKTGKIYCRNSNYLNKTSIYHDLCKNKTWPDCVRVYMSNCVKWPIFYCLNSKHSVLYCLIKWKLNVIVDNNYKVKFHIFFLFLFFYSSFLCLITCNSKKPIYIISTQPRY